MQDVGEADWNPASGRSDTWGGMRTAEQGETRVDDRLFLPQEEACTVSSTAGPRGRPDVHEVDGSSSLSPRAVPASLFRSLSGQVLSSPSLSFQLPPIASSSDKSGAPS